MVERYERTTRGFTALEVETHCRVPQATQRDWRRRGFLGSAEQGKRYTFSLTEVCILAMVKALTDAGFPAGRAFNLAKFMALGAIDWIEICQIGVSIEGLELDPDEKRTRILNLKDLDENGFYEGGGVPSSIVFFPTSHEFENPVSTSSETRASAYSFASLSDLEMNGPKNWFAGIIFDLRGFALGLSLQVGEPLITYRYLGGDPK